MKNILLVTIPHTGTRFFIKMLEQQYFHSRHHIMRDRTEKRPLTLHQFATCHTEYPKLALEYIEKFNPILITCERHVDGIMESLRKRRGDDAERHYEKALVGYNEIFYNTIPHVSLSFDAEDRQDRLDKLSKIIEHPLDAGTWDKVGSWDDKNHGRGRDWPLKQT